jgi:hypothetical protein
MGGMVGYKKKSVEGVEGRGILFPFLAFAKRSFKIV